MILRVTGIASAFAVALATILLLTLLPVRAHELSAAVMDVEFDRDSGRVRASVSMNAEAFLAGIGAEHDDTDESPDALRYNAFREMPSDALSAEFVGRADEFTRQVYIVVDDVPAPVQLDAIEVPDVGDVAEARVSVLKISAPLAENTEAVVFGWAANLGDLILRTAADGENGYAAMLEGGEMSANIPVVGTASEPFFQTLISFIGTGFEHIVPLGLDHILFVVGLFLLSAHWRPLLWQVTSFTIAHSITLAMGIVGLLVVPASIVEPIIAASIVYVGIENVMSSGMTRWRPWIVFAFGLLHGLGFAGVLSEFGMPKDQFLAALIGFNIGVELGQLAVIAVCFAALGYWFGDKPWYRKFVVVPGSLVVASIGLYWFIERTIL